MVACFDSVIELKDNGTQIQQSVAIEMGDLTGRVLCKVNWKICQNSILHCL